MIETVLVAAALVVSLPLLILSAECLAALWPRRCTAPTGTTPRPRIDVLVPAHDEASTLPATLPEISKQLAEGDRLWVVADNCHDTTADVARRLGARVLERHSDSQRGKGYALDFGLQAMADDPGDVVVVIDADVTPHAGAVDQLAQAVTATGRPIQGAYLMDPPPNAGPGDHLSFCAVTLKNLVRPAGLHRLGMPCMVTGAGVAFPWKTIRSMHLATGHIVEDLQVSVDLLLSGNPPRFCPEAEFLAYLPGRRDSAKAQRTRWEHGHLQVLLAHAPRLMAAAIWRRKISLFVAACDLSIPPLSLTGMVWAAAMAGALVAGAAQLGWAPAAILGISAALAALAVFAGLLRYRPGRMSWKLLLAVPAYIVGKVPIYVSFLFWRQREWVRTPRDISASTPPGQSTPGPPHAAPPGDLPSRRAPTRRDRAAIR